MIYTRADYCLFGCILTLGTIRGAPAPFGSKFMWSDILVALPRYTAITGLDRQIEIIDCYITGGPF